MTLWYLQNKAQEITANLRPNPVLAMDTQYHPNLFDPACSATRTTGDDNSQYDVGVGYLFERGKKRQHRLDAAAKSCDRRDRGASL